MHHLGFTKSHLELTMESLSRNQRFLLFALIAIGAIFTVADAKPPSRISGGFNARPGVFTSLVEIGVFRGESRSHLCGGAIISNRHILTAGHCVEDGDAKKLSIYGGIINIQDYSAIKSKVSKVFLHPEYSPQTEAHPVENDIAILELSRPLYLGGRLTKASLPNSPPKNHQRATIAGWGFISEAPYVETMSLKTATVKYINDEECERWRSAVGRHYMCGLQETGNVLGGDSGSPLISDGVVIGVVSSGWGYLNVPDFYTNVYDYRDWIDSILADW